MSFPKAEKMMQKRVCQTPPLARSLFLFLVWLLLVSCSGIQVSAVPDVAADFRAYKTFVWRSDAEPGERSRSIGVSDLLLGQIRSGVSKELVTRGLVPAKDGDAANADLFVAVYIRIERKLKFNDPYYSFDRVWGYERASLVIDLIDARKKKLIWSGSGETRIRAGSTPEQRHDQFTEVMHEILAQYPPIR